MVAAPTDREGIPPYLDQLGQGVEVIGASPEPNYEALAAAGPDLIIAPTEADEAGILDRLTAIAPTVTLDANTSVPWPDVLTELARLTDRAGRARELLSEWEQSVDGARAELGAGLDAEVSLVRCFRDSCRYLPDTSSFAGTVLDQLGVARPAIQRSDAERRSWR